MALLRCGANRITSLTENTREARLCNSFFETDRDATLRDFPWGFARKQAALAELSEVVTGFTYVYAYPADCLLIREIYNPAKVDAEDLIPYEEGISSTGNIKLILTEQAGAELIYTKKITNATIFDALFADAFAWRLAADLTTPLLGKTDLTVQFWRSYAASVGIAKAASGNQQFNQPSTGSSFKDSRA